MKIFFLINQYLEKIYCKCSTQILLKGFKELNQTILTNWTIAAIVASQCLPLKNVGIFLLVKTKVNIKDKFLE